MTTEKDGETGGTGEEKRETLNVSRRQPIDRPLKKSGARPCG